MLVQYAGIAGVTDLRNQVYAKVIRQPIGFFQHHPTGRVMSTVINDVDRVRNTFSEYLALGFRHIFTLFFLLVVLLATSWKMTSAPSSCCRWLLAGADPRQAHPPLH